MTDYNDIYQKLGSLSAKVDNIEKNSEEVKKDVVGLKKDLSELVLRWNKVGGALLATGAIFGFIGWAIDKILSTIKTLS